MAVSRADRRNARVPRVMAIFEGERAERALDLLELVEFAWHDCFGEVSPPEAVTDDMLVVSRGTIEGLIAAALLAVQDARDLHLAAEALRAAH